MSRRVGLIVAGALLLLCGLGPTALGGVLARLAGGDDTLTSGAQAVATPTAALVAGSEVIAGSGGLTPRGLHAGEATLIVTGHAARELFIGVGPAEEVDAYLAGVAHTEVREVHPRPFRLDTAPAGAGDAAATAPLAQTFWLAFGTGPDPTLRWRVPDDRDYRMVLMNADGSPDVAADLQVALRVTGVSSLGRCALAGGIVALLTGAGLLITGVRQQSRRP